MKKAVLNWLSNNPEWILKTEYLNKIQIRDQEIKILEIIEFGFITPSGEFYSRLKIIPNFIGVKQVIRINTITDEKENLIVIKELENLFDIHLIDEKIERKQHIILNAQAFIDECKLRKEQIKFDENNQMKFSI